MKKKRYAVMDVLELGWDDLGIMFLFIITELLMLLIFIAGSPLYLIGLIHLRLLGKDAK